MLRNIGLILAVVAIIGLVVFILGFYALLNVDTESDDPDIRIEASTNIFAFYNCDTVCIKEVMGAAITFFVLCAAAGGFLIAKG